VRPPRPARRAGAGRWLPPAAAALLALAACAHKQKPAAKPVAGPAPLCSVEITAAPAGQAPRDRTFIPEDWFVLLLQKYRPSGELARPVHDCTGQPVKLESDGCQDERSPPSVGSPPLSARDLIVVTLDDGRRLAWAITERLADGQAEGPIALVEVEPRRIAVRALGLLRAYPENVSLRLVKLAGGTVLVQEGERCVKPQAPELCQHAMRVVPLIGDRFVPKLLVDDKGACLGSAFFPTRTAGAAAGRHGAKYQLEAAVTFTPDAIAIREQLAISAAHAAADPTQESYVTRVQAERQITLRAGSLVASGPSVLSRWLAQQSGTAAADGH
jgi:hypothetical protein